MRTSAGLQARSGPEAPNNPAAGPTYAVRLPAAKFRLQRLTLTGTMPFTG
jgi:hypothetical protein